MRSCGECSLCCKVLAIKELEKPDQEWCKHVIKKKGCAIYADRPQVCKDFMCLWLDEKSKFPDSYRPDKIGAVFLPFDKPGGRQGLICYVDRQRPGIIYEQPLRDLLQTLSTRLQILVSFGGKKVMTKLGKQWITCDVILDDLTGKMDVFAKIPPVP